MTGVHTTLGEVAALLRQEGLLVQAVELSEARKSTPVSGLDCDSRHAAAGHLFACKGVGFRPDYLIDAMRAGAVAFIAPNEQVDDLLASLNKAEEAGLQSPFTALGVTDVYRAMSVISPVAWGHPDRDLQVVGITGTKGKTTTTFMVRSILDASDRPPRCALVGTVEVFDGVERFEPENTTPEAPDLWRHLAHARAAGLSHAALEVSSLGLRDGRVQGVEFAVAGVTNLGYDHVSPTEHATFEEYFASKLSLLQQARTGVVNLSTAGLSRIQGSAKDCARVVTCIDEAQAQPPETELPGLDAGADAQARRAALPADVWASDVTSDQGHVSFVVHARGWTRRIVLPMPGLFNVENALVAIAATDALGIGPDQIARGLSTVHVPGRMELILDGAPQVIGLVDFAHNKLSYQRLGPSIKSEFAGRRVIVVLGAMGGKSYERRRELPQEAARWADVLIYTEEDPALEDVREICAQMAANTPPGVTYEVIPDRTEAIGRAIELGFSSPEGAVVAVLAKGARRFMRRGRRLEPIDFDADVVRAAIASHKGARAGHASRSTA